MIGPITGYGLELKDVADIAEQTEFKVFQQAKEAGNRMRGLCAPGGGERYSRKDLDGLTEFIRTFGAKGLVWLKVEADTFAGPTAEFFPAEVQTQLRERFEAKAGDLILIVADTQAVTSQALSILRDRLAAELKLYDPKSFHYSWIIRFPLLAWDAEENRYVAEHHPFTMPLPEDLPAARHRPLQGPCPGVRPGHQRRGGRRRHHPHATTRSSSRRSSRCWAYAGAGRGEVRLPARRPA